MENSSANLTHAVKPPIAKNEGAQMRKNELNYRPVIESLNFRRNSRLINARDSVLTPSYCTIKQLNASWVT